MTALRRTFCDMDRERLMNDSIGIGTNDLWTDGESGRFCYAETGRGRRERF